MYFNLIHLPYQWNKNQVFLNRKCETVQKLFILKLEPDLDPEPENVSEHGARRFIQLQ